MEALCATCPLQASKRDYSFIVERCRAQAGDGEDRAAVLALAQGEVLLSALSESRPERCRVLDDNLPGKRGRHAHRRPDHIVFSSCAELALVGAIVPSEFPDEFDIQL